MFSVYTVCFFGHRQIDDFRIVEQRIERLIDKLLNEHEYVEFLVGRDGVLPLQFDVAESTWIQPTALSLRKKVKFKYRQSF